MIFEQIVWRDLGLRLLSRRLPDRRRGGRRRPAARRARGRSRSAQRHGATLVGVIETHTHADHVSGHGILAQQHGCWIGSTRSPTPSTSTGRCATAIASRSATSRSTSSTRPGTARSTAASSSPTARAADEPWLVLSGDALFVGDSGRPDLAVAGDEGAAALYRSLHERLGRPRRRRRAVPGPRRRLALRARHVREAVLHARLRAPLQPDAGRDDGRAVRQARERRPRSQAADHGAHRRAEPRTAARHRSHRPHRRAGSRGRPGAGRPRRRALRRRATWPGPSTIRLPRRASATAAGSRSTPSARS